MSFNFQKKIGKIYVKKLLQYSRLKMNHRHREAGKKMFEFHFCCCDKRARKKRQGGRGLLDPQFQVTVHYFMEGREELKAAVNLRKKWRENKPMGACSQTVSSLITCSEPLAQGIVLPTGLGLVILVNNLDNPRQTFPQANNIQIIPSITVSR